MSAATQAFALAGIEALGWTLLHFLWQGALAGAIFALLMKAFARSSAALRYALGVGTLAVLAFTPLVTFWHLFDPASAAAPAATAAPLADFVTVSAGAPWWTDARQLLEHLLPWLVLAWLGGVALLSWRLARDWAEVRRLVRSSTRALPERWLAATERLRVAFGIRRPVRALESALVHVPMVVGWIKPVILIPPAALLGLTAKQLELLVAHELAHIRRFDHAVNLFQVVIETLLFYHPVVRRVSARIREERELCCDDLVVASSGDKLVYARALAEMEGLRSMAASCMVMAADGGQLVSRINRLVALPAPQRGAAHWLLGMLLVATGLGVMTATRFTVAGLDRPPAPAAAPEPFVAPQPVAASQPVMAPAAAPEPVSAPVIDPEVLPPAAAETAASPMPQPVVAAPPAVQPAPPGPAPRPVVEPISGTAAPTPPVDVTESPAVMEPAAAPVAEPPAPAEPEPATPAPEQGEPESRLAAAPDPAEPPLRVARVNAPPVKPVLPETSQTFAAAPSGARSQPEPDTLTGGAPLIITQPAFPRRARVKGIEGAVTVEFTVTETGGVSDPRIVAAEPRGVFDREVLETVGDWRFEPFRRGGSPVEQTLTRTIQFQLDGGAPRPADAGCVTMTGSRLCRSPRISAEERDVEVLYRAGSGRGLGVR